MNRTVDRIQESLTGYACGLNYDGLTLEAIDAAKVRVIDTLGVLIGGFFAEPGRMARDVAALIPDPHGATVIGTRMKTTPDMAAFANGTAARYLELTDTYHWPGSYGGHPSDIVPAVLAAAEYARVSGREFINGIVLAYEVYMRTSDVFTNLGFDHTNLCSLATAVAAGKLLGLSRDQMAHCISMAVVPNNALRVTRRGHLSMWKVTATGQAGRAGVFAALLAQAGMEGPHLPFEGKAGWCDHVALARFTLDTLGGHGTPFKILDTSIKLRPCAGTAMPSALAAERIAPLTNVENVKEVTVEVYKRALDDNATGEHHWNPDDKSTADHSAPYVAAATLMDGMLTLRSYDDAHLKNPDLRALTRKIKVVENPEFTKAYARVPPEQRTRVTVVTTTGERLVGETGGEKDSLSTVQSNERIEKKFCSLAEEYLGAQRVSLVLKRLWRLDELKNIAEIPPAFTL